MSSTIFAFSLFFLGIASVFALPPIGSAGQVSTRIDWITPSKGALVSPSQTLAVSWKTNPWLTDPVFALCSPGGVCGESSAPGVVDNGDGTSGAQLGMPEMGATAGMYLSLKSDMGSFDSPRFNVGSEMATLAAPAAAGSADQDIQPQEAQPQQTSPPPPPQQLHQPPQAPPPPPQQQQQQQQQQRPMTVPAAPTEGGAVESKTSESTVVPSLDDAVPPAPLSPNPEVPDVPSGGNSDAASSTEPDAPEVQSDSPVVQAEATSNAHPDLYPSDTSMDDPYDSSALPSGANAVAAATDTAPTAYNPQISQYAYPTNNIFQQPLSVLPTPIPSTAADLQSLSSTRPRPSATIIAIPLALCGLIVLVALIFCARRKVYRAPRHTDVETTGEKTWQEIVREKAAASKTHAGSDNVVVTSRVLERPPPPACLTPKGGSFTHIPKVDYIRGNRRTGAEYYSASRKSSDWRPSHSYSHSRSHSHSRPLPNPNPRCEPTPMVRDYSDAIVSESSVRYPHWLKEKSYEPPHRSGMLPLDRECNASGMSVGYREGSREMTELYDSLHRAIGTPRM
ncbi:hypothetical protein P7C73_g3212, partial [Tremellales sp. Uapishka_1]